MSGSREPRIVDISQPVDASTACWPGDIPFSAEWTCRLADGASVDLSAIRTSPHNGTHADAPSHFVPGAPGIGDVDVAAYLGDCRVVERLGDGPITVEDVERWHVRGGERILVRTRAVNDPTVFPETFAHLDPAAAALLSGRRCRLFGIDTPSVDFVDSKTLDAHKALLAGGTAILENLDLTGVPVGWWELIAPPLRLPGLDASPVRALLRRA